MNSEIAKERLNEVLRPDTMTTSRGDFLVTHVPVNNIELYSKFDPNDASKVVKFKEAESENDIYSQFICAPGDKHQFILVLGESGAGKSHLIRWFNERLQNDAPEDEVVLFIMRSDNTLKGTIKQLLEKPEIEKFKNKDVYKRLVEASSVIDEKKLKGEILSKFILEVENSDDEDDEDDEDENALTHSEKRKLAAFLKYKRIQDKLKKQDGPIDRIYMKVAQSTTVISSEIDASFSAKDFELDDDELQDIEENADRDTKRIAHRLSVMPEKAEAIAAYLNTFLDTVIQRCSGLEAGDFEEIFKDIRREIKNQGKRLTILIEDITSFTGVNTALLNALTTEHTGNLADKDLCRVSSIIGITSGYYKNVFKTNYRDRITLFINLSNNVFSDNYLYEFFAKYLNVMSLTNEEITSWIEDGAEEDKYPVHIETEGNNWEHIKLSNGKKVSLYPFTKMAIKNLYNNRLSTNQLRTPRSILQYIIGPIVKDALYRKREFPNLDLKPYSTPSTVLRTKIFNMSIDSDELKERLYLFTCLWGNGTDTIATAEDGTRFVAGIPDFIYEELSLPLLTNLTEVKFSNIEANNVDESANNAGKATNSSSVSRKDNSVSSETQRKIEKALEVLEKWVNGGSINVGATNANVVLLSNARDNIIKFVSSAIKWQCEGVSEDNINRINKSRYKLIGFERQTRGSDTVIFTMPANRTSQTVIEAFIRWAEEGGESWNFDNGEYFVLYVETWLENIKNELISAVSHNGKQDINYYTYAFASEIYRQIFFGQITTKWDSYKSGAFIDNGIIDSKNNSCHSREWQGLIDFFKRSNNDENNRNTAINYFNLIQGKGGKRVYLNRLLFNTCFKDVKKRELQLDVDSEDPIAVRDECRRFYNELAQRIEKVYEAERQTVFEYYNNLVDILGTKTINADDIQDIVDKATSFYDEVNNAKLFAKYDSELLGKIKRNRKTISSAFETMDSIINGQNNRFDALILMSRDPINKVMIFKTFMEKLRQDMENVHSQIDSKKSSLLTQSSGELKHPYQDEEDMLADCLHIIERLGD